MWPFKKKLDKGKKWKKTVGRLARYVKEVRKKNADSLLRYVT